MHCTLCVDDVTRNNCCTVLTFRLSFCCRCCSHMHSSRLQSPLQPSSVGLQSRVVSLHLQSRTWLHRWHPCAQSTGQLQSSLQEQPAVTQQQPATCWPKRCHFKPNHAQWLVTKYHHTMHAKWTTYSCGHVMAVMSCHAM